MILSDSCDSHPFADRLPQVELKVGDRERPGQPAQQIRSAGSGRRQILDRRVQRHNGFVPFVDPGNVVRGYLSLGGGKRCGLGFSTGTMNLVSGWLAEFQKRQLVKSQSSP